MSISKDGEWVSCDDPECDTKIKNHAWGKTKAGGWFFSRDNKIALCPEHVPEWYPSWRKRKGR